MKYIATAIIKNKIAASALVKTKIIATALIAIPTPIVMACDPITVIDEGYPDTIYSPVYGTIDSGTP